MRKIYFKTLTISAFLVSLSSTAQVNIHTENFGAGTGTWTAVDVNDATNQWTATGGSMQMDGAGGTDDEDWLISPSINLDAQAGEHFLFDYNDVNAGALIELYYSTDYNGGGTAGDVSTATWTSLPLRLVDINSVVCFSLFQRHPAIDISGISGSAVYFGFKYTGTAGTAKQYQLDNIHIEAEYYSTILTSVAAGVRCAELKTEIHNVIINQTKIPYTSASYDIWDSQLQTDTRLNDAGTATIVWDMFTDKPGATGEFEFDHCDNRDDGSCPGGEGVCYNREHSFPQSWWGSGQSSTDTQYVDLHHIVPSDRSMNSAKSNNPPGIVTTAFTTGSNGFKVGANPAYPCASMTYWEPIDEYKGDYARIFFYFATRYQHNMVAWSTISTTGDCAMSGDAYTSFEPWLVQLLLEWNAADPVSTKETERNNAVYAIQGNRNPFIDNPAWIEYIWGDNLGSPCSDVSINENDFATKLNVYPNPTKGVVTVALNEKTAHVKIKITNALGQVVVSKTFMDLAEFTIELEGSEGFYILEIDAGEGKVARLEVVKM